MKISSAGLELLKSFEELRLNAYLDGEGNPTIGWGTTRIDDVPVQLGMRCTKSQATAWLKKDLEFIEDALTRAINVPVTANQFDALVCLTYNIGVGAFFRSTARKLLNAGRYDEVPAAMLRWNKIRDPKTGQLIVSNGLVNRRAKEAALFAG